MRYEAGSRYTVASARAYAEAHQTHVQGGPKVAYHMISPVGWINDPNGFSVYKGRIHLFFQHHPYSAQWGPMHWGHAVTDDLVRWTLLPEALAPDQPYEHGCFSGSAVQYGDQHALIYTSHLVEVTADGQAVTRQAQSLALGDGVDYVKCPENPVIRTGALPPGARPEDFRDPKVWREPSGVYRMVVGNRSEDGSGQILLYESDDLVRWRFVCVVDRSRDQLGAMWECPDLFPLDGRQVLLINPQEVVPDGRCFHGKSCTACIIGDWDEGAKAFTRRTVRCIDYGWDFYAPQTTLLPDGRRVMIGWMQSWDNDMTPAGQTWAGMMAFPRELRVVNDHLLQLPVREIGRYHAGCHTASGVTGDAPVRLARGRQLDLTLTVTDAKEAVFHLDVAADADHATRVTYDAPAGCLTVDRTRAGIDGDRIPVQTIPLERTCETVKLRVLLDKFSMELFLGEGEQALTALILTPEVAQDVLLRAPRPLRYACEAHEIVIPMEK